jgi:hypothetical protein
MARRRSGGGSKSGAGKRQERQEPGWFEQLENQPVGAIGVIVVVVGWAVLFVGTLRGAWRLEVTFFIAVGLLTFVLGCMSLFAAAVQARGTKPKSALRLPPWLQEFEEYFRWLTPMAFVFGLIFAHYFWH